MLPKNLIYQTKVEASNARSYKLNVAPQNGTEGYVASNTIIFNIPTRNNLVYVPSESYLKIVPTIVNSGIAQTYCRFDKAGAHGFIRKIRVFHGSIF
jgi:hypothetical protein